eukprot:UN05006
MHHQFLYKLLVVQHFCNFSSTTGVAVVNAKPAAVKPN